MIHHRDDADCDQHVKQGVQGAAPGAENPGHLLFVRCFGRGRIPRADPACPMHDRGEDQEEHHENVEIAQIFNVVRIEEAFPRRPIDHHRHQFSRPVEFVEYENDEHHHQRKQHHALHRIGNQKRQGAAEANQRNRQRQTKDNDEYERWHHHAENRNLMRQIQKVDKKSRGNGRHDHIGQHFGKTPQGRSKNPEAAVIAHFQKLPETHRPGFTKTIGTVPQQAHYDPERQQDVIPENQRKAGLVMHLHIRDQADDGERRRDIADTDHIAPGHTPRRQEIGDAAHIFSGIKSDPHNRQGRNNDNQPIPYSHYDFNSCNSKIFFPIFLAEFFRLSGEYRRNPCRKRTVGENSTSAKRKWRQTRCVSERTAATVSPTARVPFWGFEAGSGKASIIRKRFEFPEPCVSPQAATGPARTVSPPATQRK
ncbi:hypothetical protein SDC9_120236 [bioreactor metagenome]|uniref:Uncharacterized protein n=1 Tax=bioreactor metagenome TaxID=1076179 RepID=A0A645C683_9ZZZZ